MRTRVKEYLHGVGRMAEMLKHNRTQSRTTGVEDARSPWDRLKRSRVEHYSAYRSIAHPLMKESPETQFVVGNSEADKVYPRRRVRKVLRDAGVQNVTFVDLGWNGHRLGGSKDLLQRKERLTMMAKEMQLARPKRSAVPEHIPGVS